MGFREECISLRLRKIPGREGARLRLSPEDALRHGSREAPGGGRRRQTPQGSRDAGRNERGHSTQIPSNRCRHVTQGKQDSLAIPLGKQRQTGFLKTATPFSALGLAASLRCGDVAVWRLRCLCRWCDQDRQSHLRFYHALYQPGVPTGNEWRSQSRATRGPALRETGLPLWPEQGVSGGRSGSWGVTATTSPLLSSRRRRARGGPAGQPRRQETASQEPWEGAGAQAASPPPGAPAGQRPVSGQGRSNELGGRGCTGGHLGRCFLTSVCGDMRRTQTAPRSAGTP